MALLAIPLHEENMREIPLFLEPFWVYIHPEHPLGDSASVAESQLSSDDIWLLADGHCFRDQVMRLCPAQRPKARRAKTAQAQRSSRSTSQSSSAKGHRTVEFEAGTLETLRRMVDLNGGYTLLPELAVSDLGAQRRQRQVRPLRSPAPAREIGLITLPSYGRDSLLSALQEAVIAGLPESLRTKRKLHKLDVR
jgi:LysR family hydrogen peroxide-inducible transcriptional activator